MSSNFRADRAVPKKVVVRQEVFGKGPGPAGFPSSIHSSWHSYRLLPPFEMHPGRFQSGSTGSTRIIYITREIVTRAERMQGRRGFWGTGSQKQCTSLLIISNQRDTNKSCSCETGQKCFDTQYDSLISHAMWQTLWMFSPMPPLAKSTKSVPRMATIPM